MWSVDLLNEIEFFDLFDENEKKEIIALEDIFLAVKKHEVVLSRAERNTALYVIVRGLIYVTQDDNRKRVLAQLKPGDVFGEMSFLTRDLPAETVVAKDDSTLIKLDDSRLRQLSPAVQSKIREQLIVALVRRVKRMNAIVARLSASS